MIAIKYARWDEAIALAIMLTLGVAGGGRKADGTVIEASDIMQGLVDGIRKSTPWHTKARLWVGSWIGIAQMEIARWLSLK